MKMQELEEVNYVKNEYKTISHHDEVQVRIKVKVVL
jgi:hypothetical protein